MATLPDPATDPLENEIDPKTGAVIQRVDWAGTEPDAKTEPPRKPQSEPAHAE